MLIPTNEKIVTKEDVVNEYQETVKDMKKIEQTMKRIADKVTNDLDNKKKKLILEAMEDNGIRHCLEIMEEYEQIINEMINNNIMPEHYVEWCKKKET